MEKENSILLDRPVPPSVGHATLQPTETFTVPCAPSVAPSAPRNASAHTPPAFLRIGLFQEKATLEFGRVRVGAAASRTLVIVNDATTDHPLELETFPFDAGFGVTVSQPTQAPLDCGSCRKMTVAANASLELTVTWVPEKAGKKAYFARFRGRNHVHLQAFFVGEAVADGARKRKGEPSQSPPKRQVLANKNIVRLNAPATTTKKPTTPFALTRGTAAAKRSSPSRRKIALPQSKMAGTRLRLQPTASKSARGKPTATPVRQPFAAHSSCYDDDWKDKQERGFTNWVKFLLCPPTRAASDSDDTLVGYTAIRDLAVLHRRACTLFQSAEVAPVRRNVESHVDDGKIAVSPKMSLARDVRVRDEVLNLLTSYASVWLRLGLETVFGKIIPRASATADDADEAERTVLVDFINTHLLRDSRVSRAALMGWSYTNANVSATRDSAASSAALASSDEGARHALKKMLVLVLFLDRAKRARLLPGDPCLFAMRASVKSSEAVLRRICADYLSARAGDLVALLRRQCGYVVEHVQTSLDEYDYSLESLQTSLRDGVRLCRLVELLLALAPGELGRELRVPASDKERRKHNVEVSLKRLRQSGVVLSGIRSVDIVEGHREVTLELLWRTMLHLQFSQLVNVEQLRSEVQRLQLRHSIARETLETLEMLYLSNAHLGLLLQWVASVCAVRGVAINNFTASFADGRALCLLVNFYHPALLPLDTIRSDTNTSRVPSPESTPTHCTSTKNTYLAAYSPGTNFPGGQGGKRRATNERHNFKLLNTAVKHLGGVPSLVRHSPHGELPEERCVITCVAFLASRLLALSAETRAASVLQAAWRRRKSNRLLRSRLLAELKQRKEMQAEQERKARETEEMQHEQKKIEDAVVVLQCAVRRRSAVKKLVQLKESSEQVRERQVQEKARVQAVTVLQSVVRFALAHKQVALLRAKRAQRIALESHSASVIQGAFRVWRAQRVLAHLRLEHHAATVIQGAFRVWWAQRALTRLRREHCAATIIQGAFRVHSAKRELVRLRAARLVHNTAALTIQCAFRIYCARTTVRLMRDTHLMRNQAAIIIQCAFRSMLAHRQLAALRQSKAHLCAAITIQCAFRCMIARRQLAALRQSKAHLCAAITIQCAFRCMIARRQLAALRSAKVARDHSALEHHSALLIQSAFRCYMARTTLASLRHSRRFTAAITIQCAFRGLCAHRKLAALRETRRVCAAMTIQCALRGYWARCALATLRHSALEVRSAVTIQCAVRCFIARRELAHLRQLHTTLVLQSALRTFIAYARARALRTQRSAATCIQAWFRGRQQRIRFLALRHAATVLQRVYRTHRDQSLSHQTRVAAATRIQQWYRHCVQVRHAAIVIQSRWRARAARACLSKQIQTQLRTLRARIATATAKARPCDTLSERTRVALTVLAPSKEVRKLDDLLKTTTMSALLRACQTLEVASNWRACCERMVCRQNAVKIILELMINSNRSVPAMEVVKIAINILNNLARFCPEAVFNEPDSVNKMCEVLQMRRDRPDIFSRVCRLLLSLCTTPERIAHIRSLDTVMGRNRKLLNYMKSQALIFKRAGADTCIALLQQLLSLLA